ncbi:hypothetical protein JRO89_XS12G0146600 [Xanthoceras sorbifolium]|uniref:Uncharacterized protein n=1 Tax=Xanthoceras sorbifolium TaxID=99658 RepID=A0ABQ8HCN5_9ROSI|nr:hypothetical protein JRO89_XS12G0146600 [Xanthoceras sorbifolium]
MHRSNSTYPLDPHPRNIVDTFVCFNSEKLPLSLRYNKNLWEKNGHNPNVLITQYSDKPHGGRNLPSAHAIVCESISWLLIYRTNSYKSLKYSIDKASKKLETMKTETQLRSPTRSPKPRRLTASRPAIKESSRDLSLFKFKSGAVVALVLFVVFGLLNSLFEGKVVAKLPLSRIRTNCGEFLGFSPPRGAAAAGGLFPMPDPKTN